MTTENNDILISKGKFKYLDDEDVNTLLALVFGIGLWVFINRMTTQEAALSLLQILLIATGFVFIAALLRLSFKTIALDIYKNQLVYRRFFDRKNLTIHPEQIIQYGETIVKRKKHIYIQLSNRHLLLPIVALNNGTALMNQLQIWNLQRKDNISEHVFLRSKVENYFINILLVFMVCVFTYKIYIHKPYYPTKEMLTPIVGTLSRSAELSSSKGGVTGVWFYLKEYPDLKFNIDKIAYKTMHKTALFEWPPGTDAVFLTHKNDVLKGKVDIYDITLMGNNLLKYEDLFVALKENKLFLQKWGWIIILVLIILLFRKKIKQKFTKKGN